VEIKAENNAEETVNKDENQAGKKWRINGASQSFACY